MRGSDAAKLSGWIDAVSTWRTQAHAAGVEVEEISARTTDGLPLRFIWQDASVDESGVVSMPAGWRVVAP